MPENTFNSDGASSYSFNDSFPGISPAGRGSFNYEFSINANQSGMGTGVLSDFTFTFPVDSDPGFGQTFNTFNPLFIPDNANGGTSYIAQNSENPGFAFVGIPGYNPNIAGTYDFVLTAFSTGANPTQVAQTKITVNVNGGASSVPDGGSTLLLMGTAVSGLAFVRRKILG